MKVNIRLIYLYLFSFVGLLFVVIGSIRLTELAIKVYIFGGADRFSQYSLAPEKVSVEGQKLTDQEIAQGQKIAEEEAKRQRYREVAGAVAMIVVGSPLYLYHWTTIKKENS